MKKIKYFSIAFVLLILVNGCAGYEPIFRTTNLQFEIADYSIKGNKNLARQIYTKLYSLSKSNKNNSAAQSINVSIEVIKNKNSTVKNSAGKILEYKVSITSNIEIKDFLTSKEILNDKFSYSGSYKVQDEYSETVKVENRIIENLINKTYQDLLIKMSSMQ